jgi:Flp pilus assembly pilin Flp
MRPGASADELAITETGATAGASCRKEVPPQMYELLMRPLVRLQIAVVELRERQDGQTTTEYAILLGFLAIAIIIALFFLRNVLRSLFSTAASSVSQAPG